MEKKLSYTLSFIFLVFGLALLVNSQANITGAFIGVSNSPSPQGYFLGAILILISFILFSSGTSNTDEDQTEDENQE
ncbi:MAG: hypothetical protein PHV16_04770 [Candidatus Nanoarchaeia archaeon]|nr:hypothetical protein [Candidatus Nanoarchaeia archaeon]